MPKIPLYEERVAPTTQIGGAEARGADLPYKALAGVGDTIAQIGFKGAEISRDRERMTAALEQKKAEAESKLLKLDIENRLSISRNAYNSELSTRNDPRNFGTEDDKSLQAMSSGINEILSDPRLRDYPELARELQISAYGTIENAKIDAQEKGIIKLHEEGKSVFDASFDAAIDSGNADGAIQIMQESPFHTDAEKTEMSMQVPAMIQSNQIDAMTAQSPQEVIDLIEEQRSGKATHWDSLDNDALKSKAAYAKQELTSRQNAASESLNDINSEYQKMEPNEKINYLNELRLSNGISQKAWEVETDLVREPRAIDTTKEHIKSFLGYQKEMMKYRNNPEKLAEVMSNANGELMPRQMKGELTNLSIQLQDPTSKFNNPVFGYINEQVAGYIKRSGVLSGFSGELLAKIPGGSEYVKDYDDFENSIRDMAEYDIKREMNDWISSEETFPTMQEVNRKLSEVVTGVNAQYNLTAVQGYINELNGVVTESPSADKFFGTEGVEFD